MLLEKMEEEAQKDRKSSEYETMLQTLRDDLEIRIQGCKWYPSTVRQILSAEDKYRGGVRGYSPVYWPAILN